MTLDSSTGITAPEMDEEWTGPIRLEAELQNWPLAVPMRISGRSFDRAEVVVVTLESGGKTGRGEATGIYYKGETGAVVLKQVKQVASAFGRGIGREGLRTLLPPCAARNALDCALWDLLAARSAIPAWQLAGLEEPKPLVTTFTCGAEHPDTMVSLATGRYAQARALKLKLTGEPIDEDRVRAVRGARPDAWIAVDGNQGFTPANLEKLIPVLVDCGVSLIEQPFPIAQDDLLDDFDSPIPLAADESLQSIDDISGLVGRYEVMNIKLDKCGGLTEGLAMARRGRELGLEIMVGNMMGTSLSTAPAVLLGQMCEVVDLDGPILLRSDRKPSVSYSDGYITCPPGIWGDG